MNAYQFSFQSIEGEPMPLSRFEAKFYLSLTPPPNAVSPANTVEWLNFGKNIETKV